MNKRENRKFERIQKIKELLAEGRTEEQIINLLIVNFATTKKTIKEEVEAVISWAGQKEWQTKITSKEEEGNTK